MMAADEGGKFEMLKKEVKATYANAGKYVPIRHPLQKSPNITTVLFQ